MELNELLRENLKKYSAYEPGEQPTEEGWLKLNTNENSFPPIPEIISDIKNAINEKLRLYPDPTSFELRKEILNVLLRDKELKCKDIEKKVIEFREKEKLPVWGVASSNIRRQLKRLRQLHLIEKKASLYRINENATMEEIFEEKIVGILIQSSLNRIKNYFEAIDKEFKLK